ncbi:MAG: hypothetical protein R3F62_23960 [Planctomycetota bacterium]
MGVRGRWGWVALGVVGACALAQPAWAQGAKAAQRTFDQQAFELGLRFVEAQLAVSEALSPDAQALRDQSWAAGRLVWLAHEAQVEVLARRLEADPQATLALERALPRGTEFEYRVRFSGLAAVHSGVFRHVVRPDAGAWRYETTYERSGLHHALERAQAAGLNALRAEASRAVPPGYEARWRDLVQAAEARLAPAKIVERYALRGEVENQVEAQVADVRRDLGEGLASLLSCRGRRAGPRLREVGGVRVPVLDCAITPQRAHEPAPPADRGPDWADRAPALAPPTRLEVSVSLEPRCSSACGSSGRDLRGRARGCPASGEPGRLLGVSRSSARRRRGRPQPPRPPAPR